MRKDYIDLNYVPKRGEIIAEYYMEPAPEYSFSTVANAVAGESSIDTWTDIQTLSARVAKRLKPHIFEMHKRTGIMKIAYSPALFEKGSVAQLLSSLSGNILSMKAVKHIRLLDIHLPKQFVNSFPGPCFGIVGVRKIFKIPKRPLLGTIVKPKTGLSPRQHAVVAFNSWMGGLDVVKDDENLTDQAFNPFKARVAQVLAYRDRAQRLTRKKKMYMPNVTAPTVEEMIKRAKYVKHLGGEYVMVDIITSGWTALQSLRQANLGLALHAHRCGHSAFTRYEKHGMTMLVVAKLTRLVGLDQLHIGTILGKMEGGKNEVLDIEHEIEHEEIGENDVYLVLKQRWYSMRPVMAVASGGIQPLMIPKLVEHFGNDVIFQFGGGVHAHPDGTQAGAKAAVQALEAALKGIDLKKYAKSKPALAQALKKWG